MNQSDASSFSSMLALLKKARRMDRVGQAYLLVGDSPEALAGFCREWMKVAACVSPLEDGSSCGACEVCRSIDSDHYTECFKVSPLSKSRKITIDAMREFDHMMGLAVRQDHLKIGIIYEAECLNEEAQNSFLKTLEEPPKNTMLLLLTSNPRQLLPTIRSRCQIVSLLQNRRNYSIPLNQGFFRALAPLHRYSGMAKAVEALDKLHEIFSQLASEAENYVEENWDSDWEVVEQEDASIRKQMAELKQAKIDTEYCRFRELYLEAMQTWFLQRYLIAAGVDQSLLPHPELLEFLEDKPSDELEAEEDLQWCRDALSSLKANVNENVVLTAFFLQVCEKI